MHTPTPRRRALSGKTSRAIVALLAFAVLLIVALVFTLRSPPETVDPAPLSGGVVAAAPGAVELDGASPDALVSDDSDVVLQRSGTLQAGVRVRGDGSLEGRVLDRETGNGVPDVAVELLPTPPVGAVFLGRMFRVLAGAEGLSERTAPVAIAISGAGGRFHFEGVRTGAYFVDARGAYSVPESVPRAKVLRDGSGGPLDVWVRSGGRVLGSVLLPDGRPAAGAHVAFVVGPENFLSSLTTGEMRMLETVTDESGEFVVAGVPPGSDYEATATGSGFTISHALGIDVHAGADTRVVIQTRKGASITGRVLRARDDGDPEPLANAHLGAVPRGLRHLRSVEDVLRATHCTTGPDGTYLMQFVPAGDVDLIAIERTHLPAIGARMSGADGVLAQAEDIVLHPGVMIPGRVVDAEGAPVPGATTRFNLVDWKNFQFDFSLAPMMAQAVEGFDLPRTDAEGRFLAGPIAGDAPYEVTFQKLGFQEAKLEHDPAKLEHDPAKSKDEIVVVMHRGGIVEGVVMDAARAQPVACFTVAGGDLIDAEAGAPGAANPFSGGQTFEDPQGRFRLLNVRAGPSSLRVQADGYLPATVDVTVQEGGTKKGVIVQLTPGGTVRGRVIDGEGKPVSSAQVVAQVSGGGKRANPRRGFMRGAGGSGRRNGIDNNPFSEMMNRGSEGADEIPAGFLPIAAGMGVLGQRATTTDTSGRFEIRGIDPGEVRVHAFHRDHSPGSSEPRALTTEAPIDDIVVRLTSGGGIRGTVTDRYGRPVPGEIVLAFAPGAFEGPGSRSAGGVYQGAADEQGRYEIKHVVAGSYFLVATRGDEDLNPAAFFGTLNFDLVTVPPDEIVEFDLTDSTAAACRVRGVVTYRGEPVARGNLVATSTETENLLGVEFRAAKMLGGGRFEFAGLSPGRWQLQLDNDGPQVRTSIDVPDQPELEIEVRLPEGGVEGRVVDEASGAPASGVQVTLKRTDAPKARGLLGSVIARDAGAVRRTSDEQGVFTFDRLDAGEYELVAQSQTWRRRDDAVSFAPSDPIRLKLARDEVERGLTIRLLPALSITGVVTGEGVGPLDEARVVALRDGASAAERPSSARSLDSGHFTLEGLAPGKYALIVNADGFAQMRVGDLVLSRERPLGELAVELKRGVLVRVRVSQGGVPVSGARVQLLPPGGDAAAAADPGRAIEGFFRGEGATGTDGRVEAGRYAPGAYRLEAQRGAAKETKDVTLAGGESEVELHIDLD